MEGSIVSLLQTIDHDVELEIVAVLNKYREEKAENQNKYERVVFAIEDLYANLCPEGYGGKPSVVDAICMVAYDAVYYFCRTELDELMPPHMVTLWSRRESIREMEREEDEFRICELECAAIDIQAVFRGYLVRRRSKSFIFDEGDFPPLARISTQ